MKKLFLALSAICIATVAWSAGNELLTPEPERITDEAIASDLETIEWVQERLADLNDGGIPISSYPFAKAQAWLDFALDEYTENDRSPVVEEALRQAVLLIERLEEGEDTVPMSTRIIPSSGIIRPDLWEKAETMKKDVNFRCAEDRVAQLEVQLVWAGHENREFGWRHANPYLQAAERLARDAEEQIAACPPRITAMEQPAAPCGAPSGDDRSFPPAAATMSCAEPALPFSQEKTPLPDRIHFAFNSSGIGVASAEVLDRIASAMRDDPTIHVTLRGHADQRGNTAYNMKLSRLRAESVRAWLLAAGVASDRVVIAAFGKSRPLNLEANAEGYARNRRVKFLYTVEEPQRLRHQDNDLQPETAVPQER